jgi:hypothetical protein
VTAQLEMFENYSTNGSADWMPQPAYREGDEGAQTPEPPATDNRVDHGLSQDRDQHSPQVGQGPVQTIGLAQALGDQTPAPFDAWTDPGPQLGLDAVPAWLRLPGEEGHVEMDRNMRPVTPPGAGP